MSLIKVRRERKEAYDGPGKPPKVWVQIAKLVVVLLLIYYLGRFI